MAEEEKTTETPEKGPETASEEVKTTPDGESTTQEKESEKPKGVPARARIGQLTKNWREAERENERLRYELEQAKTQKQITRQPQEDDYEDTDSYLKDTRLWEQQKEQEIESRVRTKLQEQQARERLEKEQQKLAADWAKKKSKAIKQYENFVESEAEVIDAIKTYGAVDMQDAILESNNSTAIVDYLGNNPDELDKIAQLPPRAQDRAIVRLDAKLDAKPAKKATAPEPIKPLATGGAEVNKSLASMSMSEYRKWARERGM